MASTFGVMCTYIMYTQKGTYIHGDTQAHTHPREYIHAHFHVQKNIHTHVYAQRKHT